MAAYCRINGVEVSFIEQSDGRIITNDVRLPAVTKSVDARLSRMFSLIYGASQGSDYALVGYYGR